MASSTISFLLESDANFGLSIHGVEANRRAYNALESLTEAESNIMGYTLDKVTIHRIDAQSPYLVEYSNNLEKYIEDQKILTIEEAMENLIAHYNLYDAPVVIVVDESCVDKVDIEEFAKKYKVVRK